MLKRCDTETKYKHGDEQDLCVMFCEKKVFIWSGRCVNTTLCT